MKVAIIGGGVMGLTIARKLVLAGYRVDVIESQSQIGGLSTWFDYGDFIWDKYYHVILKSDQHIIGLIDELGLSKELRWTETKTGFLWQGKHISMSNHWEFLTFPVLNLFHKFRLGAGIFYSQHVSDPKKLQNMTATVWLRQIFGDRVYQTIWEPLLESKFGVLKEEVPAITLWSILHRYYSTRSSGDGKERMGHLKGAGLKVLFDALERVITVNGGQIFCGTPVLQIKIVSKDAGGQKGIEVQTSRGATVYDRVISTVPTPLLKSMAPGVSEIQLRGSSPKFLGVIRLALVLKKGLSPFYVTNLIDKGFPFTGIIEVSALTDSDELAGRKLVMVPRYDVPGSAWFDKSDQEIEGLFLDKMRGVWADIDDQIVGSYVHREKIVQALWVEAPPLIDDIPISADGLIWNVNGELCGGNTLNNNAIIGVAHHAAERFIG